MTDTTELTTITYTLFSGRKVGLPNYSNKEAGMHAQVVVPIGTSLEDIEAQVDATWRFIEAKVAQRLGLTYSLDEHGVVQAIEDFTTPAAPPAPKRQSSNRPPARRQSNGSGDKAALWTLLQQELNNDNVVSFYDNRDNKTNPKAPDFKHKDSGAGLWLDNAPEGFEITI